MERSAIISNIARYAGIEQLNQMQLQMLDAASPAIVLHAPTGSGKTIAFTAALLRYMKKPDGRLRAIILAPSRELAMQIYEVVRAVAHGYKTSVLYGGHSFREETATLSVCPDIIVATPGRLLDHINRGSIDVADVHTVVLDEYDKMLELGFAEEMSRIIRRIKAPKNIILTSATHLSEFPDYLPVKNPQVIEAEDVSNTVAPKIDIFHTESASRDKLQTLKDLLNSLEDGRTIVFVNHRESAERVYDALRADGFPVGLYHGALDQNDRATAIDMLNNGSTPILVATDLASRGLDIDDVRHVLHYHLPPSVESWTHRNGRTARMGASGNVYVITSEADTIPDYVVWDRDYNPTGKSANPIRAHVSTLYFDAGKKEKISRGDIVGFLLANTSLQAPEIGRITLRDHSALVAIPAGRQKEILSAIAGVRLKGKKVRVSALGSK